MRLEAMVRLRSAGTLSVPALIDALEDPEERIRSGAIAVLGQIGDPRAAEPLVEMLDEDTDEIYGALWKAVHLLREPVLPALIDTLGDTDRKIRWRAVALMGSLRDPRGTEPLIDLLNKDRATDVRVKIAWALGRIGDREACEALLDALHDW